VNSYNGFSPEQRTKALRWLRQEQAAGRRLRAAVCEVCGQDKGKVMEHSEDYSSPFGDHIGAHSLCFRCHMWVHCRFRNALGFHEYVDALHGGAIFEPASEWWLFKNDMLSQPAKLWRRIEGPPRKDLGLLDRLAEGSTLIAWP
jgi:hypothetical protein